MLLTVHASTAFTVHMRTSPVMHKKKTIQHGPHALVAQGPWHASFINHNMLYVQTGSCWDTTPFLRLKRTRIPSTFPLFSALAAEHEHVVSRAGNDSMNKNPSIMC